MLKSLETDVLNMVDILISKPTAGPLGGRRGMVKASEIRHLGNF